MNQVSCNIELESAIARQALKAFLDVLDSADSSQGGDAVQYSSSGGCTEPSHDEKSEYEKKIKSLDEEIASLKEKLSKKDEEIKSLRRELDGFVPNFTDDENVRFLDILDGELKHTNTQTAPYQAVECNGVVRFQFNVDKGLCKEACKDRDKMIKPFCEIVDECDEANEIINIEAGVGEWEENQNPPRLKVVTPAKVKLIKL